MVSERTSQCFTSSERGDNRRRSGIELGADFGLSNRSSNARAGVPGSGYSFLPSDLQHSVSLHVLLCPVGSAPFAHGILHGLIRRSFAPLFCGARSAKSPRTPLFTLHVAFAPPFIPFPPRPLAFASHSHLSAVISICLAYNVRLTHSPCVSPAWFSCYGYT